MTNEHRGKLCFDVLHFRYLSIFRAFTVKGVPFGS